MSADDRGSKGVQLYSEYMTHARHLEDYLLSFTQVFLLITGALWGYVLVQDRVLVTPQLGVATMAPLDFPFERIVFAFHLVYAVIGGLFVIRLGVNFRRHLETARRALVDHGLSAYAIYVRPENPAGKIEPAGIIGLISVLLTVKAFFLLVYAGAVGVDCYYILRITSESKIRLFGIATHPYVSALCVVVLFVVGATLVYRGSSKEVLATPSARVNRHPVKPQ